MYILTMIRKNGADRPDYIMTAEYANGRTMTFSTEADAIACYRMIFAASETFPVYSPKVIFVPT